MYILDNSPLQMSLCKHFLQIYGLSSHSLDNIYCRAEVSNFNEVTLSIICFMIVTWELYLKGHFKPKVM